MNYSGVYTITNLINNKIYVGSGVSMSSRKNKHFETLRRNTHPNIRLQRSFNKYGEAAFKFEELDQTPKKYLRDVENYWINLLDSYNPHVGFNIKSPYGKGLKFSPEAIEKIRVSSTGRKHSAETKKKIGLSNKGKIITVEQRQAHSVKVTGVKWTEKQKKQFSIIRTGKTMKKGVEIHMYSNTLKFIRTFSNATAALHFLGKTKSSLSSLGRVAKGSLMSERYNRLKMRFGYVWRIKKLKEIK